MGRVLLEFILVQDVDHFIVIIIRHELGLDRLISATSNRLFEDLPSRFLPLGQYHSWHFYQPVQKVHFVTTYMCVYIYIYIYIYIYKRYPSTVIPISQNFQTKRNTYKI